MIRNKQNKKWAPLFDVQPIFGDFQGTFRFGLM